MKHTWTSIAALMAALACGPALADSLQDTFVWTYDNNPTLQAERANLRAVDENLPQALSGWRPTVGISGELARESVDRNTGNDELTPFSSQLSLSQPLYRGGRTVSAVSSSEALILSAREKLRSVEQSVLLDAVSAYMNVLREQAVVQLNRNNVQVLMRQLEATQDRFRVGEITRTDVAQAEARLSRARSDLVQAEGNLISSRANFRKVVGRMPGDLDPPPPLPELPANEDQALQQALDLNPDLGSARFAELSSMHDISTVSGQLLPTVSLEASLLHSTDTLTSASETDSARIGAQVSIPLYQSGSVHSQVRQQKQINSQRRIQVEEATRQVQEQVTQAWEALTTARSRIKSNSEQVRASRIALEGVRQEAMVGSRTTLDVLDAEQELLDSQVALVLAERDSYVAAFTLLAGSGKLSAIDLGLPVETYEPEAYYRRVRGKWFGSDIPMDDSGEEKPKGE